MGQFKALGLERRERVERDRAYFDGADDDGRDVLSTGAATREEALANIRMLRERAENSRTSELEAEISGARKRPDAPHPDRQWRMRSRRVFQRMVAEMYLHVAPWHHHEIWTWAASTAAGTDWVESEVRYWENRLAREEAKRRAIREQLLLLPLGEPVDDDDSDF